MNSRVRIVLPSLQAVLTVRDYRDLVMRMLPLLQRRHSPDVRRLDGIDPDSTEIPEKANCPLRNL